MSTLPKGFTFVDDDDTDETPEVVQQQTGLPAYPRSAKQVKFVLIQALP